MLYFGKNELRHYAVLQFSGKNPSVYKGTYICMYRWGQCSVGTFLVRENLQEKILCKTYVIKDHENINIAVI